MKKIVIKGRTFYYEVIGEYSEYCEYYDTIFYEGFKEVTYKKWWLFGPEITKSVPKYSFRVYFNIESNEMTKNELRRKLERQVELLDRQEEIDRGELIKKK